MLGKLLSVGGFTLLSRLTGFARDMVLAAILGASALMDVFIVALKLPNHFRAIFGEGAFNQAYVPVYARLREQAGEAKAALFSNRVFTLLLIVQLALLVLALAFMPTLVGLIAPGFAHDPVRFDLAVALARVTFPYLTCITLVTLLSGNLNSIDKFAAAAAAPVLLNISIVAALAIAFLFPTAAHAAAWGVLAAGLLELLLLMLAARRAGVAAALARPRIDPDMKAFFKALGPAVIGSAGVQIALFADTIIASLLPQGSYAALYYAERLYQLPIGVIAIAAGTVLLPTMSRALARGDEVAAARGQNRTLGLALLLAGPAVAVCLAIPETAVGALFGRGAFDQAAAEAAGRVLAAYAIGLPAIVVIRAIVTSFHARSDTRTPVFISFAAIGLNIGLKLLLWRSHGASGLALATAAGAWANALLLYVVALRWGWTKPDRQLLVTAGIVVLASLAMALTLVAVLPVAQGLAAHLPYERKLAALALAGLAGLGAYAVIGGPSIWLLRRKAPV